MVKYIPIIKQYIAREDVINTIAFYREDPDGVDHALQSIMNIPAADVHPVKWIPVTDRLPEEKGNYLVVQDCGHGAEVHEAFFFKYFDSWEWYDPVEEYQKYNPSHWMPLPEPPKE